MASAVFKTVESSSAALVGSIPSLSAFFLRKVIGLADTDVIFHEPADKQPEDDISGRCGLDEGVEWDSAYDPENSLASAQLQRNIGIV